MPIVIRSSVVVFAIFLAGCAAYTPRVAPTAKPNKNDALVYGRFHVDTRKVLLGFDGHASMGFKLKCTDGKEYLLRFYVDKPVHMIQVSPATCSVTETVYTNGDGQIQGRKPFDATVLQNMEFKPGVAHYLGDFFATTNIQVTGTRVLSSWRIREVKFDYEATTAEMRADYPGLAGVATADRSR
jgi:hypothetical protein